GGVARRRPLVPLQALQRRLDAPVRLPRAHGRAHGRRRPAAQARRGRDPAALDGRDPRQGARRGGAHARAPRLPGPGGLRARPADDRRRPQRARAPAPRGRGRLAPRRRGDRGHGAPVPRGAGRGQRARGGRAPERADRGAARHLGGEAGRDRDAGRPGRVARQMTRLPDGVGLATRAVHAGLDPDPAYGSVVPPIHQTSTYVQRAPGEFVEDYDYSRSANPTRSALERALGELEGGLASAFASGMAAEHALITAACGAGDHLVLPADLYGGTYRLVDKVLARFGLSFDLVDQTDLEAVRAAIRPETRVIWVETPTNPLLN